MKIRFMTSKDSWDCVSFDLGWFPGARGCGSTVPFPPWKLKGLRKGHNEKGAP